MKNKKNMLDFSVALVIISSIALRRLKFLLYIIQIFFIILGIKKLFKKTYKHFCLYRVLYILFVVLSLVWAKSISSVISVLPSIFQIVIITLIMCGYVDNENKIDTIADYFVMASIMLIISILAFTSLSEWRYIISYSSNAYVSAASAAGRLGSSVGMHPNELGQSLVICILCVVYKYIFSDNKKYILLCVILFFIMLFVKSRASLIEAVIGVFLMLVFSKKYPVKQFIYGTIGILLVGLLLYSFIHLEVLYKLVGYRLEGMLNIFGNNTADASTTTRIEFVRIGWEIFEKNPVLGVGMNNFSNVAYNNYSTFAKVYAHNNYIEILSDLGIIGFFLYYWLYIKSFIKLIHIKRIKSDDFYLKSSFLLSSLITFSIMNFSSITYKTECIQYFGMLIIVGTVILQKKAKEKI